MHIEKLLLKKHLKAGSKEYTVGVYTAPIPEDILTEVYRGDVVDVLEYSKHQSPPPPVSDEDLSVWDAAVETTLPAEEKPPKQEEPLRRARRVEG